MRSFFRHVLDRYSMLVDIPTAVLAVPCGFVMLGFRRVGPRRMPLTLKMLRKIGIFPLRDHYYEPMFNPKHLLGDITLDRDLPGLDLRVQDQRDLLTKLTYSDELLDLQLSKPSMGFNLNNRMFQAGDAEFLYQMVRHLRPRNLIEIGSGMSTKIARAAIQRNEADHGVMCKHVCIEPYETPWLEELGVEVIRERVEKVPLSLFSSLGPDDLLFIDSSHVIRPQGDVLHEYFRILPSLQPGVYVHVHDIFTPREYPKSWICDDVVFWNEQYLLEALLIGSSRYRVVASLNYLKRHHLTELSTVCPYLNASEDPGSFYVQVT